jgi:hypothetical protein
VDLLQTIFSGWVQPPTHGRLPYGCIRGQPDHPFSEELGDAEINTWTHKILAHGADLNPGASPAPLSEGVDCTKVSPLRPIFGCSRKFQFLNALMFLCMVSSVPIAHHGGLPYPRRR